MGPRSGAHGARAGRRGHWCVRPERIALLNPRAATRPYDRRRRPRHRTRADGRLAGASLELTVRTRERELSSGAPLRLEIAPAGHLGVAGAPHGADAAISTPPTPCARLAPAPWRRAAALSPCAPRLRARSRRSARAQLGVAVARAPPDPASARRSRRPRAAAQQRAQVVPAAREQARVELAVGRDARARAARRRTAR